MEHRELQLIRDAEHSGHTLQKPWWNPTPGYERIALAAFHNVIPHRMVRLANERVDFAAYQLQILTAVLAPMHGCAGRILGALVPI